MSLCIQELRRAVADFGHVTRVVVADVKGSGPREVGASMLVWDGGQSGTIGGGVLELEAARRARAGPFFEVVALGPTLGQCCGGAVTLVAEKWTQAELDGIAHGYLRRVNGTAECPISLRRAIAHARNGSRTVNAQYSNGWMFEPVARALQELWIYGAGHVGRALVDILSPLPGVAITWVDTHLDRFPNHTPTNVNNLMSEKPASVVRYAPRSAHHLVLTYSHALDLEICHELLAHGFASAGLIGSATKWARFQRRLHALGHSTHSVDRIACPIGDPALGKHPQQIALSVAWQFAHQWATLARNLEKIA